jgi:hypothetical protein
MMTGMNGFRKTKADMVAVTTDHAYLGLSGRQRPNQEVSVKKVLATVIAAVVVGVVLVGGALAGANSRVSSADRQGMMPLVTVTADMPRLVMPTVEVQAVRAVAMSGSDLRVN